MANFELMHYLNPGIGNDYLSARRHCQRRDIFELAFSCPAGSDVSEEFSDRIEHQHGPNTIVRDKDVPVNVQGNVDRFLEIFVADCRNGVTVVTDFRHRPRPPIDDNLKPIEAFAFNLLNTSRGRQELSCYYNWEKRL